MVVVVEALTMSDKIGRSFIIFAFSAINECTDGRTYGPTKEKKVILKTTSLFLSQLDSVVYVVILPSLPVFTSDGS